MLHPPELSKDISKGKLSQYIYCLPSILSGMNFGDDGEELCLLKIRLKDTAKSYNFRGDPRSLDYVDLAGSFDLIDMIVDSSAFSNVRFRQILLLNNSAVEKWTHSLQTDFKSDFQTEYDKIESGQFQPEDFFMIDFNHEEIRAAVDLNAHLLRLRSLDSTALKINRSKIESAIIRLGAI